MTLRLVHTRGFVSLYHITLVTVSLLVAATMATWLVYHSMIPDNERYPPRPASRKFLHRSSSMVSGCAYGLLQTEDQHEADDPAVLRCLSEYYLFRPDSSQPRYNLSKDEDRGQNSSMDLTRTVLEILGEKQGGFFIEAGAYDGESLSSTLTLEANYNWGGILVEPDPLNFYQLRTKGRRALISPTCLSRTKHPELTYFNQDGMKGRIYNQVSGYELRNLTEVYCFPLYTYILASVQHVDYLRLSLNGDEMDVLQTLPWKYVDITIISIAVFHKGQGEAVLQRYMEQQGHTLYREPVPHPQIANYIFVKK